MKYRNTENAFERLRQTVWNRKLLIISVFAFVVLSGSAAVLLVTPKYEARMSVLISRNRVDPQISSGEKTPDVLPTEISDEEFNSELELIKNGEVVQAAVQDLDLTREQEPAQNTFLDKFRQKLKTAVYDSANNGAASVDSTIEQATARTLANLSVEPIKKSRIIKIALIDTDPARAKRVLEKIYQRYAEQRLRINENPAAINVFSRQSAEYERRLNEATDALKKFDQSNGVSGAEKNVQNEILLRQLAAVEAQVAATQTEIQETEQRARVLQEKIGGEPTQIQTGSQSKYVQALDRMKDEMVQLDQEKTKLLQKYKPTSRFVLDIEARIENLRRAIAEETANPPQERTFALNDLRRRLESDLSNAQIALVALRARETDLRAQAAAQRAEVARLNAKGIERERLERDRKINEEAFLLYQKKARENEVGQILNRQRVSNSIVVDAPRADNAAISPKINLTVLVLIGLGAFAALASAIAAENFFPRRAPVAVSEQLSKLAPENLPRTNEARAAANPPPRRKRDNGGATFVVQSVFVKDPEDEKLIEIARYFELRHKAN